MLAPLLRPLRLPALECPRPMLHNGVRQRHPHAWLAEHVKEKWAKDLYIAGIAYGRTVT